MWKRTLAVLGLVGLALATGTAGSLDPSFGTDGVVITSNADTGQLLGIAVQADGKVIAAGQEATTPETWRIRRFDADGSADSAFDAAADVGLSGGVARRVAIDSAGRIVVAGSATIQKVVKGKTTSVRVTAVVRLLSDGSLDSTFGTGGKVLAEPYVLIYAPLEFQSDGKILVAGTSGGGIAIQRYLATGALDTSFGSGGTMIDDVRKSTGALLAQDIAWGIAVQSTSIVVGCHLGATKTASALDWALRRYTSSGTLDTSFGSGGMTTSAGDFLRDIGVDSAGRIVAVGSVLDSQGFQDAGLVVRYTSNGAVDTSFASSGEFVANMTGHDDFQRVSVRADDGVVLLGRYGSPPNGYVARLDVDGAPDTSFGGDGFGDSVEVSSSSGYVGDLAVDADGNPVAGGLYDADNWLLARWLGN